MILSPVKSFKGLLIKMLHVGVFLVDYFSNSDETYKKANEMNIPIFQEPRNEIYGQRRFLIKDPNGCLIDICSPWESDQ